MLLGFFFFCLSLLGCVSFSISPYDLGTRSSKWPLSSSLSSLIGRRSLLSCVSDDHKYLFKGKHLLLMTSFQKHIANKQNVLVLYSVYRASVPQGYVQTHSYMCGHVHTRTPKALVLLDWNGAPPHISLEYWFNQLRIMLRPVSSHATHTSGSKKKRSITI